MNENQEDGVGGGGSGGGEPIGLAQKALGGGVGGGGSDGDGGSGGGGGGCCCPATLVEGTPVKCHDANDPSGCGPYEHYSDGACNPPPTKDGLGICSISSAVGDADHGVVANVEGFGLFFVLALCAAMRRRTR